MNIVYFSNLCTYSMIDKYLEWENYYFSHKLYLPAAIIILLTLLSLSFIMIFIIKNTTSNQLSQKDKLLEKYITEKNIALENKLIIENYYKKHIDELKNIALFDSLTGIFSKYGFYTSTTKLISKADSNQYTLYRCDINRFKVLNELFGTVFGDNVLKIFANSLQELIDNDGTCGRFENDNFLLCLPTNKYSAKKIYSHLSNALLKNSKNFNITPCIGIYTIENPSLPISLLCDRTIFPLNSIKGAIVNGYAYYDNELRTSILQEQELFNDMNSALEQHQFEIYLQPIYRFSDNTIAYAEALIRWKHPKKGLIPPNKFIPYSEKNGFINEVDLYVWDTVCKYLKSRKDMGKSPIPISINISRISLCEPNLCETLVSLINKYELDPSLLKLEITETSYMDDSKKLLNVINTLKKYGFEFFMDDFGSGYSSLGILKDIPFNIIKLDMSFLSSFETSPCCKTLLSSILKLTQGLHKPVIMEGVETKEQVAFLKNEGFEFAQGYFFAQPMNFDDFEKHLEKKLHY